MRWSWHGVDMVTTTWCQDGKNTVMTTHMVSTSSWHDDQRVITQQMTWWRNGIWQWTHLCFDWPPADHRKKVRHGQVGNVGTYEGLAPSMWAFPAWFWQMSETCMDLRYPCPPKAAWCWGKKNGRKPAQKIAKNRSFLGTYMARTTCLKMELLHLSPLFSSWHRWRTSIFRAMYFQSRVGDKQSFFRFLVSAFMFSFFMFFLMCDAVNVRMLLLLLLFVIQVLGLSLTFKFFEVTPLLECNHWISILLLLVSLNDLKTQIVDYNKRRRVAWVTSSLPALWKNADSWALLLESNLLVDHLLVSNLLELILLQSMFLFTWVIVFTYLCLDYLSSIIPFVYLTWFANHQNQTCFQNNFCQYHADNLENIQNCFECEYFVYLKSSKIYSFETLKKYQRI